MLLFACVRDLVRHDTLFEWSKEDGWKYTKGTEYVAILLTESCQSQEEAKKALGSLIKFHEQTSDIGRIARGVSNESRGRSSIKDGLRKYAEMSSSTSENGRTYKSTWSLIWNYTYWIKTKSNVRLTQSKVFFKSQTESNIHLL